MIDEDRELANARVGYQVAASLWVYEGNLIWSKFNALLVAHSIVLAGIGLSMTSGHRVELIERAMPLAGFALSILWFLLVKRGFDNYVYWVWSARELEERHLARPVETVSRGGEFADGKVVRIRVGVEEKELTMPRVSRLLKAEWASYGVIAVFSVFYVILGLRAWGYL